MAYYKMQHNSTNKIYKHESNFTEYLGEVTI